MTEEIRRVRAWVLVTAEDPEAAADELSSEFTEGGDEYVVVRADVVEGEGANLIVPVDAADEAQFNRALELIRGAAGTREVSFLRVTNHRPDPPHGAHTYVTPDELAADYVKEYDPPGRHPKSPGRNGWG